MTPDRFNPVFLSGLQKQLKGTSFLKTELSVNEKTKAKRISDLSNEPAETLRYPSNATVNRKIEVVTSIMSYSAKQRRIPFNPCANFTKLPDVSSEMGFWERSEAEAFLKFANGKYPPGTPERWKYVVYLVALNCALRAGEVWGLQPRDIKSDGTLFVRRQFERVTG